MKKMLSIIMYGLLIAVTFGLSTTVAAIQRSNETVIAVPGSPITLKLWEAPAADGRLSTFYQIIKNGQVLRQAQADYELGLRYAHFDPLKDVPAVPSNLTADANSNLYIVQFVTQPLVEFENEITNLGGSVRHYIAQFALLVEMDPVAYQLVSKLPYVRWIGPYQPAYRLDETIRDNFSTQGMSFPAAHYNVQVLDVPEKAVVADRISSIGGIVENADAGKMLVEATLTPAQIQQVARWDEVNFIDVWGPYETDMDIVRQIGGANYLQTVTGFTGQDVRGEVFDQGFQTAHVDFQAQPFIQHGAISLDSHGTACAGINFGTGTGSAQARGLLPSGQGIVATYQTWGLTGANRYTETMQLLQSPYYAVFQTSSVGSPQTTQYTTFSAEADAFCFDSDIAHCQSQSNNGSQSSRPQAWAKNMISGGALYHYNTLSRTDDMWNGGASIGPASDGRIKPTLIGFYDQVYTTYTTSTNGYGQFSGTSSATPIIAGHAGLVFQMWDAGIFGNPVNPGWSVFQNRCHATTAKALLINTAYQYAFSGTTGDKIRTHQGWGMPDLQNLYSKRNQMYIVDESDVLLPFGFTQHQVTVNAGEPELKVTMVYADPPGNPAVQTQHRINDLTLKVTSPTGTIYWGNNGLYSGNWSTAGGSADTKNTEENVFIQNPTAGQWTVEIQANEVIQDGHVESTTIDADYALVVSGVAGSAPQLAINVTATNPPIVIPANGGSFQYSMNVQNLGASPQTLSAWTKIFAGGSYYPAFGPATRTLPGGANPTRLFTQTVASTLPAGTGYYIAYVGTYPNTVVDSSYFTFTKSAVADGGPWLSESRLFGNFFEEYTVETNATPSAYELKGAYPNPFNPTTNISYNLGDAGNVKLTVFDVSGREVATLVNGYREAGAHSVTFDASKLTSGVYIYRLTVGGFNASGKMVLMK
ncbi:MAG: S8 family peptidase [bacterium]|nr:S8 family peptidase [bacterium]